MSKLFAQLGAYINKNPELNIRLFKILGIGGFTVSVLSGFYSLFEDGFVSGVFNFVAALMSVLLLYFVEKTGRYILGYVITTVAVFMGVFALLYFGNAGIEGALPYFFVFSIVFTFLMFQGALLVVMASVLSFFYLALIFLELKYPELLTVSYDEKGLVTEKLFGIYVSALTLGFVVLFYLNEYRKQKKIADEASKAKSTFLANMSHEIRTPINSVIGFNEIIESETNDENIKQYANNVKHAGEQLLYVVNQVLDFSRLDSGKEVILTENYNLHEIVGSAVSAASIEAKKKNLKTELFIDDNIVDWLVGDREKIQRVLTNLVSNAIKYTNEGQVFVRVDLVENSRSADGTCYQKVCFAVKDTGVGISDADMKKLFQSYERVDLLKNQKIQGTGLGLAISKQLVALMGGEIQVESTYGEGSTFRFELTQKVGNAALEQKEENVENQHFLAPEAQILVVDDSQMNRLLIKEFLKHTLIRFDMAEDGKQCLEMVAQKQYDMILMDYMMPGMDGLEAMEIIRKQEVQQGKHTPILVLTADVVEQIDQVLLRRGFDAYISKPIDSKKLIAEVLKYLPSGKVTLLQGEEQEMVSQELLDEYISLLAKYDVDMNEGLKYVSRNVEQYTSIVRFFENNYVRARQTIENAFDNKELEKLTLSFHSLKGNAKNVGAVELYELSKKLEKRSREGDFDYIKVCLQALLFEWDRSVTGIRQFLAIVNSTAEEEIEKADRTVDDLLMELIDNIEMCEMKPAVRAANGLRAFVQESDLLELESMIEELENLEFDDAEPIARRLCDKYGKL